MATTPSTERLDPWADLGAVSDLSDHLQTVNLYATSFPNALTMLTELEAAAGRLRNFVVPELERMKAGYR